MQLNVWKEDLTWCPSQCYYHFIKPGTSEHYCIYLRWRWCDPWTAQLIPMDNEGNDLLYDNIWEQIELDKDYNKSELEELEEACINYISERFPTGYFPNNKLEIDR